MYMYTVHVCKRNLIKWFLQHFKPCDTVRLLKVASAQDQHLVHRRPLVDHRRLAQRQLLALQSAWVAQLLALRQFLARA